MLYDELCNMYKILEKPEEKGRKYLCNILNGGCIAKYSGFCYHIVVYKIAGDLPYLR